jgi:hypothetical protein
MYKSDNMQSVYNLMFRYEIVGHFLENGNVEITVFNGSEKIVRTIIDLAWEDSKKTLITHLLDRVKQLILLKIQ